MNGEDPTRIQLPSAHGSKGRTYSGKWFYFSIISMGTFLSTLNASAVNIAIPILGEEWNVGVTGLQWILSVYLLVICSTLPSFGRLGDMKGKGFIFSLGLLIFTIGSFLCGLATSLSEMIAFRIAQALGASMMMANNLALIVSIFPDSERGRALGTIGSIVSAGMLAGPAVAGLLIELLGWRWVFFVSVPLGVVSYLLVVRHLSRRNEPVKGDGFDILGSVTFAAGICSFLVGLSNAQDWGWGSPLTVAFFAGSISLFILFIVLEYKARSPMIDLSLFRNPVFTYGNLAGMSSYVAGFFLAFLMPFYLTHVLMLQPGVVGLMMMPSSAAMIVIAPLSGWLSDRMGPVFLTTTGMAITATALLWISSFSRHQNPCVVALSMALTGVGSGLFNSPNNSSIMGSVPAMKSGIASAIIATFRNVGMLVGVALAATVFSARLDFCSGPALALTATEAFARAFSQAMLVDCGVAFVGTLLSAKRGHSLVIDIRRNTGFRS